MRTKVNLTNRLPIASLPSDAEALFAKNPQATARARLEFRANRERYERTGTTEDEFVLAQLRNGVVEIV